MTLLQLDVPFVATSLTKVTVDRAAAVVGGGDRGRCSAPAPARSTGRATGPGQVIDGGVVSLTVMVCVQVVDVPARVRRPDRSA